MVQPLQSVTTDSGSLVWLPPLRPLSLAFWEVEEAASAESLRLLTALGALPLGGLDGVIAPRFLSGSGVPPLGPTGGPSAVGGGISSGSGDWDREALSLAASATTFSLMSVLELAPGPHSTTTA